MNFSSQPRTVQCWYLFFSMLQTVILKRRNRKYKKLDIKMTSYEHILNIIYIKIDCVLKAYAIESEIFTSLKLRKF